MCENSRIKHYGLLLWPSIHINQVNCNWIGDPSLRKRSANKVLVHLHTVRLLEHLSRLFLVFYLFG